MWDEATQRFQGVVEDAAGARVIALPEGRVLRVLRRASTPAPPIATRIDVAGALFVVRGGTDREFDVHDLATGALLAEIVAPAALTDLDLCDLAEGRLILHDVDRGMIAVFDARTGARQVVIEAGAALDGWSAISRDGSVVAAFDREHAVRVFDGSGGRELALLRGHRGGLQAIRFSPDGRRLATASEDGTILVWDVAAATGR
jgi:WD40 repeat protein